MKAMTESQAATLKKGDVVWHMGARAARVYEVNGNQVLIYFPDLKVSSWYPIQTLTLTLTPSV